jgi:hypothetical protein
MGIIIIYFLIIYSSPSRSWKSGSGTENYQNRQKNGKNFIKKSHPN